MEPRNIKQKARLVFTGHVYHQIPGHEPTILGTPTSRTLESEEQVYVRRINPLKEDWSSVDFGWIQDCGLLVIENIGDVPIDIGVCDQRITSPTPFAIAYIFPKEDIRLMPISTKGYYLRTQRVGSEGTVVVNAFPR